MKKHIVLCADDYGQAEAVSEGILALLKRQRLSATSCIVNTAYWSTAAQALSAVKGQCDVGLHLNFTEGEALSAAWRRRQGALFPTLPLLLAKGLTGRLALSDALAECHAQLDAFVERWGTLPDFIDGHHHVHQFPVIREALVQTYAERFHAQGAYIRLVDQSWQRLDWRCAVKRCIIYLSGTEALKKLLLAHAIPHNQTFSGIYAFQEASNYANIFPQFLGEVSDQGLIMCHPGFLSDPQDRMSQVREIEWRYLNSDQFVADCEKQEIVLSRFNK
ncbi:MAG TPA: ChbG/HpnK family deacetylase [Gammaproteobacteria bacterium]|jgi:predicted glycoside hydrolase/deacetylase ChbG (UPF0249 family)|nr:ChbG/HpnK family deacetylase [Gammaproteobacteria bacterium]